MSTKRKVILSQVALSVAAFTIVNTAFADGHLAQNSVINIKPAVFADSIDRLPVLVASSRPIPGADRGRGLWRSCRRATIRTQ